MSFSRHDGRRLCPGLSCGGGTGEYGVHPDRPFLVKTKLACSGSMMRSIPRFVDEEGREFLPDYFPPGVPLAEIYNDVFEKGASWPVSSEKRTCLIDIAVSKEMFRGHRVFLDYGENPQGFRFQDLSARWQERYRSEMKKDLGVERRGESPLRRLQEINPASMEWLRSMGSSWRQGIGSRLRPLSSIFRGALKFVRGEIRP